MISCFFGGLQLLYESPFEGQLVVILNDRRRRVGVSDAFPETIKLDKGVYTVEVQVRHGKFEVLDKLRSMCLVVKLSMSAVCSVPLPSDKAIFNSTLLLVVTCR